MNANDEKLGEFEKRHANFPLDQRLDDRNFYLDRESLRSRRTEPRQVRPHSTSLKLGKIHHRMIAIIDVSDRHRGAPEDRLFASLLEPGNCIDPALVALIALNVTHSPHRDWSPQCRPVKHSENELSAPSRRRHRRVRARRR